MTFNIADYTPDDLLFWVGIEAAMRESVVNLADHGPATAKQARNSVAAWTYATEHVGEDVTPWTGARRVASLG